MSRILKYLGRAFLFVVLTVVSQVGGLVYFLSAILSNRIRVRFSGKGFLIFIMLYVLTTFLIIPYTAPFFGREKIKNNSHLQAANYLSIFLNRNYVTPETNVFLQNISNHLDKANSDVHARYLDACFPFFKGFPLLPHLSHKDGCKIDFSLVYEDEDRKVVNKGKSRSGYGVFEDAKDNEFNQCSDCLQKGYFQYDYPKYLTLGKINSELKFSKKGTKELIDAILSQKVLSKMFIEPHLKNRMNLSDSRIRFHGCGAVRHDDHIHVQIN
ncbi:hypothetical protein GCQ56_12350 [Marinifilum sp. N1E240]|uniref:hypothetical protein n=1 Tax=Marinifilum sp. N1E240 TaxID=2608082 RepID=UPI00128D86B9|nr:hypothetical protein [Marinifilum sp. N1E240]MPQ47793.1 hypothetical protein [Marinifilum sp. N1E240]